MNKLIVVDKNDKVLGYKSWEECHRLKGILHRAFSIFIFNNKNELLLQKRSKYKPLWPLYWSNTCCSHPGNAKNAKETDARNAKKNLTKQAEKRVKEELGFSAKLKVLYKFCCQAVYKSKGSENELCYVLLGKYDDQKIKLDKKEVADCKWISFDWLKKDINKNPDIYTPWLKMELKEFQKGSSL